MPDASRDRAEASDRAAWRRHLPHEDVDRVVSGLGTGSLHGAAAATASERPDAPALLFPAESDRWIAHGELLDRAARTAGWLVENGLQPGNRVLLCGRNASATVIAYLAALRSGATVVLADPELTAAELVHLVDDSGADWALAAASVVEALRRERPERHLVSLDEPLPESGPAEVAVTDLAMLAYTSGTTGAPKGVELTHGNLLASIRAAMAAWRWRPDDVLVHCLPLSHQHGLGGVHATLIAGSSAVILPKFDPAALIEAIRAHRASVLFAVPAIYERLAGASGADALAAHLRLAVSGSAPLPPELAGRIADIAGAPPLERYGSTESGLDVSNPLDGERVPGTVGFPLPGVELRIVDDAGAEAAPGEDGEILLRGPQVFARYWNAPEATEAAFADGWFRTGDIGRVDGDTGHLSITGRKKELVITGGMNVYPREVETALEKHPSVAEAAVAGVPSDEWGEEVTAWIVPRESFDPEQLLEHARSLLAPYKCPKRLRAAHALPRNDMGKIQRSALVAETQPPDSAGLERAIAKLWKADLS